MDHPQKTIAHGFTLVELLMAMALGLIVLTSISSAFISQRKTYALEEQNTQMIQTARAAMDLISSELKLAGYNWDPTGASTLQTTDSSAATYVGILYDATQLQIKADLNSDGETDETATANDDNEEIIYTEDSGNLEILRTEGGTTITLAENIEDFTSKYFRHDSATGSVVEVINSANEEQIRVIEISITARTAEPDPNYSANSGYRTYTLVSYITPPNLRN